MNTEEIKDLFMMGFNQNDVFKMVSERYEIQSDEAKKILMILIEEIKSNIE